MKRAGTLLLTLILSGFSALRCGATVYQSDGSAASVQGLHNAILNGDTIKLPAGTFTWTTRVNFRKAITLQGTGIGATIIRDAVQNGQLISINLVAGRLTRLTGIEFQNGGRQTTAIGGTIRVEGSNTNGSQFRFDHNAWNRVNGTLLCDTVIGVIDHNQFTQNVTAGTVWIYGSRWDGRSYGDGSWAAPTGFGSSQFLFIEDNTFRSAAPGAVMAMTDAYGGARFVVRHNQINDCSIANHGTESTTRPRGGRAMEIYGNTFRGTNLNRFIGGARSGTAVIHDNNITGYLGNSVTYSLSNYRGNTPFEPWSGADGVNAWDVNAPNPFFTGTAASNSSGRTVSVSGNPNWTVNQWIGYTIRRTSNLCGSRSVIFALIISNTANTLTYADSVYGNFLTFCAGDSLEIRRVEHALDQPGRAGGSLITGDTPVRPRGWNDQVTEPIYSWNNTPAVTIEALPNIRPNVHFFNNTALPGYTPYVYPHPLVSGGSPSPSPNPSPTVTATPIPSDFNDDGKPDFLLNNPITHQTSVWYMRNHVRIGSAYGPTLWPSWNVAGVADFNLDGHPDYLLFRPDTGQTAMWHLNNRVRIGSAWGPTLWPGWNVASVADFNLDDHPDYLLFRPDTGQTAIWYLSNNVRIGSAWGPTLWPGWNVADVADFNLDGHPDYLLFRPDTGQTAMWYLNNNVRIGHSFGPTLWPGWNVAGVADFNLDGHPDYLLFRPSTGQIAIWYLDNNVRIGSAWVTR